MKTSDNRRILEVLSVTTLASFIAGFNARLAVVGLPTIAGEIGADVWSMIWIIQGFMLGSTIFQLIIGRLTDLYGRVRLFTIGIGIFTIGALLSGLSSNPAFLIISRTVQGIGGAFLMSISITILTDNVPPSRLGTWLGVNQVAWRIGALLGLTLSGFIIDLLSWHWIFLIQVPIGVIVLFWTRIRLKEVYKPKENIFIDIKGFTFFTLSLTLSLIGLTIVGYGYRDYSYILLALSVAFLAIFVYSELKTTHPALDLRLFKIWQFSGGIISQLLYSIGFGASLTLLAIYMQSVLGYSPSETGILLVPYEASYLVFGIIGGRLSDILGFAPVNVAGLAVGSISLFLLSLAGSIPMIIFAEVILGVGTGLFVSPNTSSIMTSVPPDRRGVASSIRAVSFNVGFAISLNIAILTMTQKIPYTLASHLIVLGGILPSDSSLTIELTELGEAIKHSFLVQALIMALAIPFSISRMKKVEMNKKVIK
ncbi:MFS transporter [Fervidicoccus fontis]|uniref:MFS transporter n=1 Tax=Fervidicoccus fontis TaxID=683846 RepID=A0A2J6N3F0_9CREN|nr:MFS transporter [Fervidicoccus fontis]PMB75878.1 MAG: MFS transporter [Fervidicoccus fontis]PMB77757.1 MAG: MFS transporter [Fervidicoccus fontis]HEW64130.1 MFS transporter [Fervidicoccus fontis]